jgi:uncharacterized protein
MIDIHAHLTTDLDAQLRRARQAGIEQTVLLSTRVHPEQARTIAEVREEFARLGSLVAGGQSAASSYAVADRELSGALAGSTGTFGMRNLPVAAETAQLYAAAAGAVADPRIVGIGELTPAAGQADQIERVVEAVAATAVGRPLAVLVHGFAPNTAEDLASYAGIAARYRRVPIIIGAFGGLHSMLAVDLVRQHPNLYLDLSSALQVFVLAAALREVPQQCLFGSNTPYGDVVAAQALLAAATPDPAVRRMVSGENAASVLGI